MPNIFNRHVGVRRMLDEWIPNDGCLIIFNVSELQVRQQSCNVGSGMLTCSKISKNKVGRHERGARCDMYVGWKQEG